MKKTKLLITTILLTSVLASCASNKTTQTAADSYDSDLETIKIEKNTNEEKPVKAKQPAAQTQKRTASDKLRDLVTFTHPTTFLRYDTTTLFTAELGGIKEKPAEILIRYEDRYVGWGSTYAAAYYMVLFDKDARKQLALAAESYLSDFENKRLQRNGKHTERAYGKINYGLQWGATSATTPCNGKGEGYVGYEFVKNSPYFTIRNYPFENEYFKRAGEATTRESMTLRYYFTRAQIKQLLELISEENIADQLNDAHIYMEPTAADDYDEYTD